MEKKTTAKLDETKAAVKAAEAKVAAKVEETKTAAKEATAKVVAKVEETKNAAKETEVKAATKVEEPKKTAAETAKKRKPRTKTAKKAAKEELKPEVYIQYQGREGVVEDAIKKVTEQFVAEGHRASTIKPLQLYLKPEENAAYYVINQKIAGRVDLF